MKIVSDDGCIVIYIKGGLVDFELAYSALAGHLRLDLRMLDQSTKRMVQEAVAGGIKQLFDVFSTAATPPLPGEEDHAKADEETEAF